MDHRSRTAARANSPKWPNLAEISRNELKAAILRQSTSRLSEPERWMRWTAGSQSAISAVNTIRAHSTDQPTLIRTAHAHGSESDRSEPTKRLYVGNLPYQATDSDLADLFRRFGKVLSAGVISDRDSMRSKGHGFVEMPNHQAEEAVSRLNGLPFGGRNLVVTVPRPREERPDRPPWSRHSFRRRTPVSSGEPTDLTGND